MYAGELGIIEIINDLSSAATALLLHSTALLLHSTALYFSRKI